MPFAPRSVLAPIDRLRAVNNRWRGPGRPEEQFGEARNLECQRLLHMHLGAHELLPRDRVLTFDVVFL